MKVVIMIIIITLLMLLFVVVVEDDIVVVVVVVMMMLLELMIINDEYDDDDIQCSANAPGPTFPNLPSNTRRVVFVILFNKVLTYAPHAQQLGNDKFSLVIPFLYNVCSSL